MIIHRKHGFLIMFTALALMRKFHSWKTWTFLKFLLLLKFEFIQRGPFILYAETFGVIIFAGWGVHLSKWHRFDICQQA
jgi:hypothetical protein